jgi:hypothetical protein
MNVKDLFPADWTKTKVEEDFEIYTPWIMSNSVEGIQKNLTVREWSTDLLSFSNKKQWWNNHILIRKIVLCEQLDLSLKR